MRIIFINRRKILKNNNSMQYGSPKQDYTSKFIKKILRLTTAIRSK
jgi:hypothetical protein